MNPGDADYLSTKVLALRLLLSQIDGNNASVDDTHQEIEASLVNDPHRMSKVLAHMLGIAAAEVRHRHHNDRDSAAKWIERRLAEALDATQTDD